MQTPISTDHPHVLRIDAAAVADAASGVIAPGSLLLRVDTGSLAVLASGSPEELARAGLPPPDRTLALPDALLIPGLVNAHTHLDLSHIGPVPHDPGDGFVAWVDHIRAARRVEPDAIADAVRLGVDLSLRGGTAAVGDIAGAPRARLTDTPARVLGASPLAGVSFIEFFGIGRSAAACVERLSAWARDELPALAESLRGTRVRVGLQPHAPNTVDLGVYRWAGAIARAHALPLATHLAETPEEREFVARGTGPQRAMLEGFGLWDESVLDHVGKGRHPVEHLGGFLGEHRVLCAHVNDATDGAIATLARTRTPVAYCPRASRYFDAATRFGPHRYLDMLDAGVPVCLGTDSIVNLDTPDRISVLDEMRLLHRRDGADPWRLLAMATTHGARALGLDPTRLAFGPGPLAMLLAVPVPPGSPDAWAGAMGDDSAPSILFQSRESF